MSFSPRTGNVGVLERHAKAAFDHHATTMMHEMTEPPYAYRPFMLLNFRGFATSLREVFGPLGRRPSLPDVEQLFDQIEGKNAAGLKGKVDLFGLIAAAVRWVNLPIDPSSSTRPGIGSGGACSARQGTGSGGATSSLHCPPRPMTAPHRHRSTSSPRAARDCGEPALPESDPRKLHGQKAPWPAAASGRAASANAASRPRAGHVPQASSSSNAPAKSLTTTCSSPAPASPRLPSPFSRVPTPREVDDETREERVEREEREERARAWLEANLGDEDATDVPSPVYMATLESSQPQTVDFALRSYRRRGQVRQPPEPPMFLPRGEERTGRRGAGSSRQGAGGSRLVSIPPVQAVVPYHPNRPAGLSEVCESAADKFDDGHLCHVGRANAALCTLVPDSAVHDVGFGVRLREVMRMRFISVDEPHAAKHADLTHDLARGSCRRQGGGRGEVGRSSRGAICHQ